MTHYGQIADTTKTPQTERAKPTQVENNAGGFVFAVDKWTQLDRFLILGQCGPTYYASERKVVSKNAEAIKVCIAEDGARAVARIVEISDAGRAPKNDPALFALALAASAADPLTRRMALDALPKVARIGTHLFHFVGDVAGQRRWGRGLRSAVARWYTERSDDALAMQAIKYQQRDGWSHRDVLRLAHPKAKRPTQGATFRWMVGGKDAVDATERKAAGKTHGSVRERLPALLAAYDELHASTDLRDIVRIIAEHNLPREAVPTQWLGERDVWEALLPHMGLTAMVRNLAKMTAIGLVKPMSDTAKHIAQALGDRQAIRKARVHPMALLLALGVYRQGHGEKGKLNWQPAREILDALDAGFYLAFDNVEPSGKRTLLAIDVSGSMDGGTIAGAPGITPRIAAAAMAMVTARAEERWYMLGFTSSGRGGFGGRWGGGSSGLTPIDIGKHDRLDTVREKMARLPMGGTDCALPMLHAAGEDIGVDVFHVYTDCETWAGNVHPHQALQAYRAKSGIDARLAVVAFTATEFTIADPTDAGMLDVVGMDAAAPALLSDFARGLV